MKTNLILSAISVLALVFSACCPEEEGLKNSRPNIILVMTDDQGSNLSFMGHPILATPNIDAFAEKSLFFKEFHVSPTCAPTRAALLSGRHEFRNGVTHTVNEREYMALSTTTIADLLQEAGYSTGIFGKWHLGDEEEYWPVNRGFTEALTHGAGGIGQDYPGSCADFPPNREREGRYFNNVLLHNDMAVQTAGYCTDLFFKAALAWMKQEHAQGKPFFAYIPTNTPHSPLIAPEENLERIIDRHPELAQGGVGRFGMIENIDDNFGLMMEKLEDWGMLDNTLIIFTSDNGAPSRQGGKGSPKTQWNYGYKTGKGSPYEGGTHVPAFWYWKGVLEEGSETNALTAHIDLFRTFCDLAGAEISADIQEIDGRSLLPLLEDPLAPWDDRKLIIHRGRWNKGAEPNRESGWAVRTQRWRLVGDELYDIAADPKEETNVAAEYPDIVKELTATYHEWWEETVPLMINEERVYEDDLPPLEILYEEQKIETGIPVWDPQIQ